MAWDAWNRATTDKVRLWEMCRVAIAEYDASSAANWGVWVRWKHASDEVDRCKAAWRRADTEARRVRA